MISLSQLFILRQIKRGRDYTKKTIWERLSCWQGSPSRVWNHIQFAAVEAGKLLHLTAPCVSLPAFTFQNAPAFGLWWYERLVVFFVQHTKISPLTHVLSVFFFFSASVSALKQTWQHCGFSVVTTRREVANQDLKQRGDDSFRSKWMSGFFQYPLTSSDLN